MQKKARVHKLRKQIHANNEKLQSIRARFESQIRFQRASFDSLHNEYRELTIKCTHLQQELDNVLAKLRDPRFGLRPRKRRH